MDQHTRTRIQSKSVDVLELDTFSLNALKRAGILTISVLAAMPESELRSIYGIGKTRVRYVVDALDRYLSSATTTNGSASGRAPADRVPVFKHDEIARDMVVSNA